MSSGNKFSRRRFMQLTAMSTGGIYLLSRCSGSDLHWRFLTGSEAQLMDSLADQIIPPDGWPGGRESGVTNYIDKQLTGPFTRYQSIYQKGLAAIQETCKNLYNKKFEELNREEQTVFLEKMESGKMTGTEWSGGFDREFFALFCDHSMQAYYGSPRHGGNLNNMSYKMLKLDYPLIIGQNRYNT
jgi:gluconate 2-dehydrogenase gamma chain